MVFFGGGVYGGKEMTKTVLMIIARQTPKEPLCIYNFRFDEIIESLGIPLVLPRGKSIRIKNLGNCIEISTNCGHRVKKAT